MRLNGMVKDLGHVPVMPLLGYPGLRLNNTTVRDNVQQPATHLATARAIHERFAVDG